MEFNDLLIRWAALGGFGALIAFLINILKTVGVVKPDQAPSWSAGLNLLGLTIFLILGIIRPDLDMTGIDESIRMYVQIGIIVFGYIVQLLGSKLAHYSVSTAPLIGTKLT